MAGQGIIDVGDGKGLSPLLQWWTMAIHPPFLYLGYVGFTVPFAFAMASLDHEAAGRRLDSHHAPLGDCHLAIPKHGHFARHGLGVHGARLGRLLGLGSGRECFADALDYRDRLPAFRHDAGEEGNDEGLEHGAGFGHVPPEHLRDHAHAHRTRRLRARVRAIAGQAVLHYFLSSALGLPSSLIVEEPPYLKSEVKLESVVSRESSFLFNNLILLASCFAVLWGTLFPVIMEAVTGEKETIDAPYYNRVNIPIALFLMFLTGVGPLIAWRKSSLEQPEDVRSSIPTHRRRRR